MVATAVPVACLFNVLGSLWWMLSTYCYFGFRLHIFKKACHIFLSLLLCFCLFFLKVKNNLLNSLSCIIALINIITLHRFCWKKRFTCMVFNIDCVIVCSKKKRKNLLISRRRRQSNLSLQLRNLHVSFQATDVYCGYMWRGDGCRTTSSIKRISHCLAL